MVRKKDYTYLQEYQDVTGTSAAQGQPKYYAMFGGGTGESDTTSGRIAFAPVPNTTYRFRVHFNKMPDLLEGDNVNYLSMNFFKWSIILLFIRGIWLFKRSDRYVDFV